MEEDSAKPTVIGAGSFARVYEYRHFAWKTVLHATKEDNQQLRDEYEQLESLHQTIERQASSPICFLLPTAQMYYNPETDDFRRRPSLALVPDKTLKSDCAVFRSLDDQAKKAIYCMQRVPMLSYGVADYLRSTCYPMSMRTQPVPTLCRIYFGRDTTRQTGRFFSHKNFPLDRERYALLEKEGFVAPAKVVARAMGHMLASLHWRGHNDARDVEFVLGGDVEQLGQVSLWVIDFNQTRTFRIEQGDSEKLAAVIQQVLARSFFDNDPYYPRPRPADALYQCFRIGYLEGTDEHGEYGKMFLDVIEDWQKRKDDCGQEGESSP